MELLEVVSRYLSLTMNGREAKAACPFHEDSGQSLRVGDTWRCLGCNEEDQFEVADAAAFLQAFEGISREEAERKLGNGSFPPPLPIDRTLKRAPFFGIAALVKRPQDRVWIHDRAEAVYAARELVPERIHLGLIEGRSWADLSLLNNRHVVLVPTNTARAIDRMGRLADCLYDAGHSTVRWIEPASWDGTELPEHWTLVDAKASGATTEQVMEWAKDRVRAYPKNDAAQQGEAPHTSPDLSNGTAANVALNAAAASPHPSPAGSQTVALSASARTGEGPNAATLELPAPSLAHPPSGLPTRSHSAAEAQQPGGAAPSKPPSRKADTQASPRSNKSNGGAVEAPVKASVRVPDLLLTAKGEIKSCDHNAKELIAAAQQYDGVHFDDFLCRLRIGERDWSDHDDRDTLCWLQAKHDVAGFNLGHTRTAIMALGYARRIDSLSEFVMGVPAWDGTPRIETAFIDAWGAPDTPLNRAASRNLFIAMHARAVKPGSQVDNLWVIEGPQGALKSASLRALGLNFHAEISASVGTADFLRELRGIWIAEMSELDSLRGREASTIKRLLSAPSDRFVDKYDRHAVAYPRRAVVVATTNEANYWQDATGARRLIPVRVGAISLVMICENRLQWFAEARAAYDSGATWWEFPTDTAADQEDRQVIDPWEDILSAAIEHGRMGEFGTTLWPDGWISSATLMKEWLQLDAAQQGPASGVRLGKVMRRLGFSPQRFGKERERGWIRESHARLSGSNSRHASQ